MRPNIYELLKSELKVFDVLIDVGCAGDYPLYDLVDFDNSCFKKLIGIDIKFEKEQEQKSFDHYVSSKKRNKTLNIEDWTSGKLRDDFNRRFQIVKESFFDYDFGVNRNSLIICNKVLHFYDNPTKFEQIKRFHISLQEHGLLFLKINHYLHPVDTDPTKMRKKAENIYQSIDFPDYEKYLIRPLEFTKTLMEQYNVLKQYLSGDNKALTLVIKK